MHTRGVNVSEQRSHQREAHCAGQAGHAALECTGPPPYSWTLHHVTPCVLLLQNRQAVAYSGRETSRHLFAEGCIDGVSERTPASRVRWESSNHTSQSLNGFQHAILHIGSCLSFFLYLFLLLSVCLFLSLFHFLLHLFFDLIISIFMFSFLPSLFAPLFLPHFFNIPISILVFPSVLSVLVSFLLGLHNYLF